MTSNTGLKRLAIVVLLIVGFVAASNEGQYYLQKIDRLWQSWAPFFMLAFVLGIFFYAKHLNKHDLIRSHIVQNLATKTDTEIKTELVAQGHKADEVDYKLEQLRMENTDVFAYFKQKVNQKRFFWFLASTILFVYIYQYVSSHYSTTTTYLVYGLILIPLGSYLFVRLKLNLKLHNSMMKAGVFALMAALIISFFLLGPFL